MSTDTPTPRTDAAFTDIIYNSKEDDAAGHAFHEMRDFARQLECELAVAEAALEAAQRDRDEAKKEVERLKGANARHVIAHIERICPECGHNMDEDKRCASCLQSSFDLLRDEFQRILALNPSIEIVGLCERAVSGIERLVPITVERDSLARRLKAWKECAKAAKPHVEAAQHPFNSAAEWLVDFAALNAEEQKP